MDNYRTVLNSAHDEFTERKSRFIGYVRHVTTGEEAVSFINEIRSMHRDASHNVYAYILRNDNIIRYSDDGEPGGTAGVPVLDVIKKEKLTDICVVVTRYFGGTLLGAGGLVRAYTKGAKIGIDAAGRVKMLYCSVYKVVCDYSLYGKISYEIESGGHISENTSFEGNVSMTVCVKHGAENTFEKNIADISGGNAICECIGEKYTAVPD